MPGAILSTRRTAIKNKPMLGEGMPWHIILPCLVLGVFLGIYNARKYRAGQAPEEGQKNRKMK